MLGKKLLGRAVVCASFVVAGMLCVACGQGTSDEREAVVSRAPLLGTFRVGDSGYVTSDDVTISNQSGGNGITDRGATQLLTWKKTGSDAYEIMSLIRFSNLALPPGSTVTAAQLTLTFENWWTGFTLRGYYLKNSWSAAPSSGLGWLNRDAGLTWAIPGARGMGTDLVAGASFANSSWVGNGDEVKTFDLDPAIVQSWVDNPTTNQGVLLVNNESDDKYLRIYSSEDSVLSRRPQLSITYTAGASCSTTGVGVWKNTPFSTSTNPFTVSFDAKPSAAPTDAVIGLSLNGANAFSNLATSVRFNSGGTIDARNGGAYAASATVPYSATASYHFRLLVDVAQHTYSVFVTPPNGSEVTVGNGFAFRSEQTTVSSLNNWAMVVDSDGQGNIDVCNFSVSGSGQSGGGGSAEHPRIFLDAATLSALRAKTQTNAWTRLRDTCNSYLGGGTNSVCYPPPDPLPASCSGYPNLPNVGEGYQGDGYADAVLNLGICYQIGLGSGDANTSAWGARGAGILATMSQFTGYQRDAGYGIRNFGVGMALGFDWLYPALSTSTISQVASSLNGWIDWYDTNGLSHGHPHSNYFAGYYAAKAYAALATEGDNPKAPSYWGDFLERVQRGNGGQPLGAPPHGGVAAYYTSYLTGGGWYDGWQYGNLAVQNMSLPSLAARTAKGLDLITDSSKPYGYPLESALHLLHFSWPSRDYLDDRDTLHGGGPCRSNARPSPQLLAVTSAMLTRWSDPLAAQFHRFAREARTAVGASAAPWADFLFWDDAAPEQDYSTLPRAFRATNYAAMRSSWATNATWASFRASAYVDSPDQTEQFPDAGSLAIVRGNLPFLVNPEFLHTCYGSTPTEFGTQIYNEVYGGPQSFFNAFYNGTTTPLRSFTAVDGSPAPQTRIASFEDGGGYVLTRARDLEDVYLPGANVTSWSRDVMYVRPSLFVVYDRTSVANTSGDQHMNWHFPSLPAKVTPAGSSVARYEVSDSLGFKGALTPLLPPNALVSGTDVFSSHKLYRAEVRPSAPAMDTQWLTVLDAAASASSAGVASTLASSSNVKGALIVGAGNVAVLFGAGAANQAISGNVTFSEPAAATKVVVSDLTPNAFFSVSVTTSGGTQSVTVQPSSSGFKTSAAGVLYVNIAATGTVTAGS